MKPTKEWEKEVIKVYDKRFYRTKTKDKTIQGGKTFGLNALDIDEVAPEKGLFDRSENVSFAKVGIPLPTYSTGFDAFDGHINKYYHPAADEADSIDHDYLVKFYQGYILLGRSIANDPKRPYWMKNDLYGKVSEPLIKLNYKQSVFSLLKVRMHPLSSG